jgi:hypothetical protein
MRDGVHIGVSLWQCDAGFQASHDQYEMKVVIDLLGFERQRDEELGFETVGLAGGQDTNNSVRPTVQANALADDVVVAAETLHPKAVRHNDDAIFPDNSFIGQNVTPQEEGSMLLKPGVVRRV